jgi:hypothetical protein
MGKFIAHGWAASGVKGLTKVATIGTGIAGLFGSDAAAQYGAELTEANRVIGNGQFDMGAAGVLIEETPALIIQLALTRGLGMGATATARGVGATGTWGTRVVKGFTLSSAAVTAGAQSAGNTFIQSRADGRSEEEARQDALKAGMVTAIITGTFSAVGAGGPERFATNLGTKAGNAMQTALARIPGATRLQNVTVGQFLNALPKGTARDAMRRFATATLQSGAEGVEEGLDQLVNTMINANPDTNLADLWSQVSDAFVAGALLGAGAEGVDISHSRVTAALARSGASPEAIARSYRYRANTNASPETAASSTDQSSPDAPAAVETPAEAPVGNTSPNAEQNADAPAEGVSPGTAAPNGQDGPTTETKDAPEGKWTASSPGEPGLTSAPPSGARSQDTPAGQTPQDGTVPATPGTGTELPNGSAVVANGSGIAGEQKLLPKNEGGHAGNPISAANESPKDSASIKERVMATRPPDADTSPVPADIRTAYTTKTEGWRHKIIEWARSVLPGEVNSKALGKIEIGKKKIRGAFGHGRGPLKILSVPYIPEMLQNGIPFHSSPQEDGSIMHNLAHRIQFDGEDYVAILAIEELRGKRFYNHEFTEIKKLEELSHDQAAALDTAHPTPQTARTVLSNIWKVNPAGAEASTERNNSSVGSDNKTAANATPASETKGAQATQRPLGEAEPPFQITSQPGPGGNVADPLHPIKDTSGAPTNVSGHTPVQNEPGLPKESGTETEVPGAFFRSGPTTNVSESPAQSYRKSPANPETAAKVAIEREAAATIATHAKAGGMDDASAHRHAAQAAPVAAAATTLAEDLADHLPQTRRAAGDIAHALTRDAFTPSPAPDHLPRRLATPLAADVPAVPWTRADRSGVLDGEWTSDPATLQNLLPKVTRAAAQDAPAAQRASAFRSLTDPELTALGVPPQDIPSLRETLDGPDFNAIRAGMAALRNLSPNSPDASTAATDLAETTAADRATVPTGDTTIQRLPNGRYRVHDPDTGEEIGHAPNRAAATRMARRAAENSDTQRASLGGRDVSPNNPSNQPDPAKDGNNSLTQKLRSIFAKPLSESNFEPYHENRPAIIAIAAANGIEPVRPRSGSNSEQDHQSADTRRICESLGVDIIYYRGGPEEDLGFTPAGNPELIFLNVSSAHTTVPMGCTFAHELLHVAQKDASSGGRELGSKIESLLTSEELAAFHTVLGKRYHPGAFATELPAFLTGDAISGDNVFGLDRLQNAEQIRQTITEFFNGLGKLNPSSLDSADDSELAALPDKGSSKTKPSKVKPRKDNAKTRKAAERKKIHDEHHRTPPPDPTKKWSQEFYEETARQATVNPDSDTVVLGKYRHPDGRVYTKVAGQRGATYFKVENWKEVTTGMDYDQMFEINLAFLDQQIAQGKTIIFSHDPHKADGFFKKEIEYLEYLKYEFPKENNWTWRAVLK